MSLCRLLISPKTIEKSEVINSIGSMAKITIGTTI